MVNPHIFRAYDIRGIVPDDLNPPLTERIGLAFGSFIREDGGQTVVVGRDVRLSSPELAEAYISGVRSAGCDVVDLGLCTSPMLYRGVIYQNAEGGTMITGSHNPIDYNGLKMTRSRATPFTEAEIQGIRMRLESAVAGPTRGSLREADIFEQYADDLTAGMSRVEGLQVVVDAGNGACGEFGPELLRRVGCKVDELYCELDGTFPNHLPDPAEEENVRDLMVRVTEIGADAGIAFDGDGDRIGVVDERGRRHEADLLLAVLARPFLRDNPGETVLLDIKCSEVVADDIRKHGGVPVFWKTGHALMKRRMNEDGIRLGGEVSGHLFFAEGTPALDDPLVASLHLLRLMAESSETLSAAFDSFPHRPSTPELKAPCPDTEKFQVVEAITQRLASRFPESSTIDGIRLKDEHGWALIRASNTSPNLTLRIEADDEQELERLMRIVAQELDSFESVQLPDRLKSVL